MILPATLLLIGGCSPGESTTPGSVILIEPSAFAGANARRHVDELAGTIGSRPAGSVQERTAAAYLSAQLTKWGYQVRQQPFSFKTVADHSVLHVFTGGPADVRAWLFTSSAQGTVRGVLADGGLGIEPESGSLTGRVVLLERGEISFLEKVGRAARAGATAALIFNNVADPFYGSVPNPSTIPVLIIAREDGLRLRQAVQAGEVQVEMRASAEVVTLQSQNVVARTGRQCAVIVGGHYDSVNEGAGANDNASGTGVTLELARALAPLAASGRLCFVAFGAEEVGPKGSLAFVEELDAGQRSAIVAMINLDMVGAGTNWADRVGLRTSWAIVGDSSLAGMVRAATKHAGVRVRLRTEHRPGAGGSDDQSFTRVGIPAVSIHLNNDAMYHTAQDTPGRVDPANLEAAGRIVMILVQALMKQDTDR